MIVRLFRGVGRHIRDAFRNFYRNFMLSITALASINVALLVVSLSILIGINFDAFVNGVEEELKIVMLVKNETPEGNLDSIRQELEADERTTEVVYSSKDEQLKLVAEQMPKIKEIASQYEGAENPLFRVFYIKVKESEQIASFVEEYTDADYVESIKYGKEHIDKIIQMFYYSRIITIVIIGSLLLVSLFIVSNTIRITIYTRKEQVDIMKLVGASNYHIRMPYIYEGVLIGLFGSILPILITIFGYKYAYDNYHDNAYLKSFLDIVEPDPITYYIAGGLLVMGVFVGMFGSAISIRKFVRK